MAYKEVDASTFQKRNEVAQSRRTGDFLDYWTPKVGPPGQPATNKIRILPPHEAMPPDPFYETKMHFLPSTEISPKNGRPIPIGINCLKMVDKACPACAHVDELFRLAKGEDDADAAALLERQAKDKSAKLRVFINMVDMDHPDKGVQRYAFGTDVEKKLRMCFYDDEQEWRNITHPVTGRVILLLAQKKPKTDFNDYVGTRAAEKDTKLPDMDWLEKISDLTEVGGEPTLADMAMALRGERPKRDEKVSVNGAKPATVAPKAAAKSAPAPAAATKPAAKSKRQAVVEPEPDVEETAEPYAGARAMIAESYLSETFEGATEITPDVLPTIKTPACYMQETDPADPMCQGCRVLLPCLQARLDEVKGAIPWGQDASA